MSVVLRKKRRITNETNSPSFIAMVAQNIEYCNAIKISKHSRKTDLLSAQRRSNE